MEHYTTHIKSKTGWFDIDLKELWRYRDLISLSFKRNYSTKKKQTILGPKRLLQVVVMVDYWVTGYRFTLGPTLLLAPVLVVQAGVLGLGCGIIVASLTTRYRDLAVLVSFGVSLWMYATPVVYTAGLIPEIYLGLYIINPMSPIMECWRNAVIGSGTFYWGYWATSWVITLAVLTLGVVLFSHIEKTFMDTV